MLCNIYEKFQRKKQLRILKKYSNTVYNNLKIGISNQFIIYPKVKKISLGNNLNFRNYIHIIVQNNAELVIENNVFLNNFCSINCLEKIEIGENTLFGENVKLYDHNHAYQTEPNFTISHSDFNTSPIKIGKNCWLGSNVTILKGVTIGDNSIIGAGCVIYKDIPTNSVIVHQQNLIIKSR
jgi:acetyltransferase-like isoleucine patch superfamily enzyme